MVKALSFPFFGVVFFFLGGGVIALCTSKIYIWLVLFLIFLVWHVKILSVNEGLKETLNVDADELHESAESISTCCAGQCRQLLWISDFFSLEKGSKEMGNCC